MFGLSLKRKSVLDRASRVVIETLESRMLLSASVVHTVTGDLLRVNGTNASDKIVVGIDGTDASLIDVTINGHQQQFSKTNITSIFIQGFAGNDRISVDESHGVLPTGVKISGGTGNDTITGSSLADGLSGGAGNDYISGNGGDDTIIGKEGNDIIWGDAGNDNIDGNAGRDEIFGGDGTNTLMGGEGNDTINSGSVSSIVNAGSGVNHVDDAFAQGATTPIQVADTGASAGAVIGSPTGYSPTQIRHAYDFGDLTDSSFTNRGQDQAVAVVIWGDDPTALSDLAAFSFEYNLTQPTTSTFKTVYASGTQPATDLDAAGETSLDVQWIHAIAPAATIYLVEAASNLPADILQAVQVASTTLETNFGGGTVNMSFGFGSGVESVSTMFEPVFTNSAFKTITYVASAGDEGGQVNYPSTSGRVLSVGGTNLPVDSGGNATGVESAWDGGGGGISTVIPTPVYQTGLSIGGTTIGDFRATPDVSADADPNTGVSVYTSFILPTGDPQVPGDSGWHTIGGTSASAPMWSGLIALVNQKRQGGALNLIGAGATAKIYGLAQTSQSTYFNDITSGSNGFPATSGYDLATGWGTPKALALIDAMADNQTFATGTAGFDWNSEYKEAVSKYPGGNVGALFADFKGSGTAFIGLTQVALTFNIENQVNGTLLQITANNLTRETDGHIFGTGSATVEGPQTGTVYTLSIAGFVNVDGDGNLQIKGSFTGLSPLTGTDPVQGLEEQYSGKFSSH